MLAQNERHPHTNHHLQFDYHLCACPLANSPQKPLTFCRNADDDDDDHDYDPQTAKEKASNGMVNRPPESHTGAPVAPIAGSLDGETPKERRFV